MRSRRVETTPPRRSSGFVIHVRTVATPGTRKNVAVSRKLRGALAEGMLSHRMTVAEVAERLGYTEVASFSHAFKRWKGTPPSVYRARA